MALAKRMHVARRHYTEEVAGLPGNADGIFMAFRIAEKYRHRLPTPKELQSDWGMHRATAYRWLSALRAARGVA